MARRRRATDLDPAQVARDASAWYRERLSRPAPAAADVEWLPVAIGPTWQRGEDGCWLLPERTLGWEQLGWASVWLQLGDGVPWEFTDEQARWLLHWYAVDEFGRFVYQDGVLQRLKGWGKDPLGAVVLAIELVGPCRFSHFDASGEPVARDEPKAWAQTAATALEQTKNTMRLFPSLFTRDARDQFDLQVLKRTVYAMGGTRVLEAVTSSPTTLEGARATVVLKNETHHWLTSNEGHEMAAVIRRNATKSPGGAARSLAITNAYDPNDDSVAQMDRESWEKAAAGGTVAPSRTMYDSLEAPPEAPYTAEAAPAVVAAIRGDADWLDVPTIVGDILDLRTPPSQGRRYWYNQVVAHEEAWTTPQQWDTCADPSRRLEPDDTVVLFFDGSKSDDATGLVLCRIDDGHVFTAGCWQRPKGVAEWSVPRGEVDEIVGRVFELYDVRGFFADPGAGEDESGERYWDGSIDRWARDYGTLLNVWAVQTGDRRHPILWDMSSPVRQAMFTEACERTLADIIAGGMTHDGDPRLRDHVRNARRRPNRWGVSIGKEHRESARKVDLAVCMIGARMLRRIWQALPRDKQRSRRRSGKAAFW